MSPLAALSWFYQLSVRCRNMLYDRGYLPVHRAPLPTISIGNLAVGGTGKTQVALLLAETLAAVYRVAILLRGYRGQVEKARSPLHVDPHRHTALESGDEAWMMAARLPTVQVIAHPSRRKSSLLAAKEGAHLLLLDDGMQHRQLHRDLEIVVLDTQFSFSAFFPSGRRREEYYRLTCADLIFFIGTPPPPALQERIALFTSAPQVIGESLPIGYFDLSGRPLAITLRDQKIGIFCGIGQPSRFIEMVKGEGAELVYRHLLPDHGVATEATLQKIALEAQQRGAKYLVCTEKDRVKLPPHFPSILPIIWLKITLQIVDNQSAWHNIIREIKQLVDRSLCHHRGDTKI